MKMVQLAYPTIPLWRDSHTLQLGEHSPLTFIDAPVELADAVNLLHYPTTREDLISQLPELSEKWLDYLLALLSVHNLLLEVSKTPTSVAVFGSSHLAQQIVSLLNSMVGIQAKSIGHGAESILLPSRQLRSTRYLESWPTLTVLATTTAEPDRTLTDELCRTGRHHLIVRLSPGSATVGPFVLPGLTSCLRCDDLRLSSVDESWPHILAQLIHFDALTDPFLLDWAVSTACAQIGAYVKGAPADTMFRSLYLDSAEYVMKSTEIPIHPTCVFHDY